MSDLHEKDSWLIRDHYVVHLSASGQTQTRQTLYRPIWAPLVSTYTPSPRSPSSLSRQSFSGDPFLCGGDLDHRSTLLSPLPSHLLCTSFSLLHTFQSLRLLLTHPGALTLRSGSRLYSFHSSGSEFSSGGTGRSFKPETGLLVRMSLVSKSSSRLIRFRMYATAS